MTALTQIGFIGLGNMGGRMSTQLVKAGFDVFGFDPTPGAAEAAGARPAASARQVAETCEVVLLSLPDSRVVEAVIHGSDGIVTACHPGQIVVDLSTSDPASTIRLNTEIAVTGARFVDAGISGGAAAAEKGALTLMVGGDPADLERLEPVFGAIASSVHHMGQVGSGHTTKVLNNFLNAVSLAATAEVMVAAKKSGLDLGRFLDVLNGSSGTNFATQKRFPFIIKGDYLEGGLTSRLMTKDVMLYVDLLAKAGVSSLNAAGPLSTFGLANALGYGDKISNRVVDALGDVSGGVRLSSGEAGSA